MSLIWGGREDEEEEPVIDSCLVALSLLPCFFLPCPRWTITHHSLHTHINTHTHIQGVDLHAKAAEGLPGWVDLVLYRLIPPCTFVSDGLITSHLHLPPSSSLPDDTPHHTATQRLNTPSLTPTMSKRKGMSLEEKRATILNIYHTGPVRRKGGRGGAGGREGGREGGLGSGL